MMKVVLLALCVALAAGAPRLAPPVPALITQSESRIVGGVEADVGQFPFQGSLLSSVDPDGTHTCGAVYMGGVWALCAAHCTQGSSRSVWFGIHRRSETSGGQFRNFTRIVNHPFYNEGEGTYPNDISLLEMTSSVSGDNIAAADLPSTGDFAGEDAIISGWGRTCSSCSLPDELMYAEMQVLSQDDCEWEWGSRINDGHICIYDGVGAACNGDSGGPMSIGNSVIGLTSWGIVGCGPNYSSVYTRITFFRDWIEEVTGI